MQNFDFCYFLGYDFGFRLFSDEILDLLAWYTPSRPLGYVTGIHGTGIPDYTWEIDSYLPFVVSQPSKCLKFMTFRQGCFVIHVRYKYLIEALETFYCHQFYKRRNKIIPVN